MSVLGCAWGNRGWRSGGQRRAGFVDAFALFVSRFLICRVVGQQLFAQRSFGRLKFGRAGLVAAGWLVCWLLAGAAGWSVDFG